MKMITKCQRLKRKER